MSLLRVAVFPSKHSSLSALRGSFGRASCLAGFRFSPLRRGGGAFAFALALSFTCPWLPVRGPWSSCLSLPGKYISYEIGLLRLYEAGTPTCAPAFGGLNSSFQSWFNPMGLRQVFGFFSYFWLLGRFHSVNLRVIHFVLSSV